MTFSSTQIERYARHLVLPEIGGAGQQRLREARVLVVGAGGLGSPAIQYLAAAGVGHLRVVDDDVVSLSNLQRQVLHATASVGRPKVESAVQEVARLNPDCAVDPVHERLTKGNVERLLDGVTVALDGSDNFATRYLVADACEAAEVPLVTAAVGRFDGTLTVQVPQGKRYRDLFPEPPPEGIVATCAEAGILGAVTGVMGALQAAEAIKLITGAGDVLAGEVLMVDLLSMRFDRIAF